MGAQPSSLKASIHTVRASPQFVEFEPRIEKPEQNFLSFLWRDTCLLNKLPETMSNCSLFIILHSLNGLLPFFYFLLRSTENNVCLPFSIFWSTLYGGCSELVMICWERKIKSYQYPACLSRHAKAQADLPHESCGLCIYSICMYNLSVCLHKHKSGAH